MTGRIRFPRITRFPIQIALAASMLAAALPADASAQEPVAFVDVMVVPMTSKERLPHHTVVVQDGQIAAVAPASEVEVPAGAMRIDGRGKWLVPGLVDMHVHLFSRSDLDLYLANGVTTIRNLGGYGAADSILEIRRAIEAGDLRGPTIFTSGNWLDGDPPYRDINTVVRTPEEARREVERQHRAGYDFIKVYQSLSPEVYAAIVDRAKQRGMPVTGHVPGPVGIEGVLRSRQSGIEHAAAILLPALGFRPTEEASRALARQVAEAGVAVTPTLWILELAFTQRSGPAGIAEIVARPEMRYLPPERFATWRDDNMFAAFPRLPAAEGAVRLEAVRRFVGHLHDAGARILAGTDADVAGSVPGFAIHEELRRLVEAGLTPREALQAATAAPAEYLAEVLSDLEPFGTIEVGGRADLILLDADPLEDVAYLEEPAGVMARGTWFPASELRTMLDAAAR
jgi:imidazolonepropionase-like amidohydrolase